jgi:hypothetical protein
MIRRGYGCWPEGVPARALEKNACVVHLVPHGDYPCGDHVLAEVRGTYAVDWAEADQTIDGTRWEGTGDPGYAYAHLMNYPDLANKLRGEGYKLDLTEYPGATFCDKCRTEGGL